MNFETIKQAIEIAKMLEEPTNKEQPSVYSICVLDRGWVYVGELTRSGDEFTLKNAKNISNWGTEKGIGQLQLNGPTEKTKVFPCGNICFSSKALIFSMPTEQMLWNK